MSTSSSYPRLLCRSIIVGALAAFGLLAGVVPELVGHSPTLRFGSSAYAESVSNEEVTHYAKAVLLMEPFRQSALAEIKKIIGSGNVPNIVCSDLRSLQSLPNNAHSIAANYCEQSKKIVGNNGLSISRFNAITINAQSDPDLKTRIKNELLRLQRTSP